MQDQGHDLVGVCPDLPGLRPVPSHCFSDPGSAVQVMVPELGILEPYANRKVVLPNLVYGFGRV